MPITFRDVSFTYAAKTPFSYEALKGINLQIDEGDFVAIVGRTGCGKSTLIQHMNALLNPSQGCVEIDDFHNDSDKKKRTKKVKPLRQKVGMVFQFPEYQLFEETVEKDVAFAPKNFGMKPEEALQKAHEALGEVGLDESFYTRSPFELSGGEKRRVAIAGILAASPEFLVVDEPTAGLDPKGAETMMDLFRSIHEKGTTIILVTHDMDLVLKYCNKVIVIDDGEVAEITTPDHLFDVDVERYSLQSPLLFSFASSLLKGGLAIERDQVSDVPSLAKEIARCIR
ncbi:MAG: energy-coupling factor transporter ATPase [Bacilli bacterium]|nr:energy-coupling factor transporter ATPase [Bacilli bacterium]